MNGSDRTIAEGIQDHLELGNMDSLRDWGYAKDYVECMWMIMQHAWNLNRIEWDIFYMRQE